MNRYNNSNNDNNNKSLIRSESDNHSRNIIK